VQGREGGRRMKTYPIDFKRIEAILNALPERPDGVLYQFRALQDVVTAFTLRQHLMLAEGAEYHQDLRKFYAWYLERLVQLEPRIRALAEDDMTFPLHIWTDRRAAHATITAVIVTVSELRAELEPVDEPSKVS